MPREILNERSDDYRDQPTAVLSWGWALADGQPIALLEVGGVSTALDWADLDRLNRAVRRGMKCYRKQLSAQVALPSLTELIDELERMLDDAPVVPGCDRYSVERLRSLQYMVKERTAGKHLVPMTHEK